MGARCSLAVLVPAGDSPLADSRADPHAELDRHRHVLALDVAFHREYSSWRAQTGVTAQLREGLRPCQVPSRRIAQADVAHLPLAHQGIEPREHLLDQRLPVPGVKPVEVDVVLPQPPQLWHLFKLAVSGLGFLAFFDCSASSLFRAESLRRNGGSHFERLRARPLAVLGGWCLT